jgi:protein TonB
MVVDPGYPASSIAEASVVLQLTIGTLGTVEEVRVIEPVPLLEQIALKAVRQWKFRPALRDSRAVRGHAIAVISFRRPVTGALPNG